MSNHWYTIIALTLICSLPLQLTSQAQQKDARVGTATVSGRVTIKGEPAQGVSVFMDSTDIDVIPSAKTDENGYFRITGLPAGRYLPISLTPGYVMPGGRSEYTMVRGTAFQIGEGDAVEKIDIELIPGGVITGRVTGLNGRPLVDELVELWGFDKNGTLRQFTWGLLRKMLTTDDRGIYRVFGLPEGRYILCAGGYSMGEDRFIQKTYHPNVTDKSQAKVVELGEGEEVTGVDIDVAEVKKTYSIFGRVVNTDNGQPVTGATISLGFLSENDRNIDKDVGFSFGHSNSKGEFQLSNVPPGKFVVSMGAGPESDVYSEPVNCEVINSDVNGIEVRVRKGGSVNGVFVLENNADPGIIAKMAQLAGFFLGGERGQVKVINADSQGRFQVKGLPKGTVRIQLLLYFSLIRIERDGVVQPGDAIVIDEGENVSNLRLFIALADLSLRGEIKIIGGTLPPQMLTVYASRVDGVTGNSRMFQVDARNQFLIERLSPGEYELHLKVGDYQTGLQQVDAQLSRKISQFRQKVVLNSNNQQPVILTLDLSQGEGNR